MDASPALPDSLSAWLDIDLLDGPRWYEPWVQLLPFFRENGYEIYRTEAKMGRSFPTDASAPAVDSFGLYGDRGAGYIKSFRRYAAVFPARDRLNRDVVIKVISKAREGANELEILRFFNSEPLKSDPRNATVPVVEFLAYGDWTFAVMPMCDTSDELPVRDISEAFELVEQTLAALVFLHDNRVAHLDVSHENIMINHHGRIPPLVWQPSAENLPNHFRTTFPIRYWFMDFGCAVRFEPGIPLAKCQADPTPSGREHRAPEASVTRYNPFAADVYQIARMFYSWFYDFVFYSPRFLKLLQDMTEEDPALRPTAAAALTQLQEIRPLADTPGVHIVLEMEAGVSYPEVIRGEVVGPPFPPRPPYSL